MKIKNKMYLMCCVDTRWGDSDINFPSHCFSPPPNRLLAITILTVYDVRTLQIWTPQLLPWNIQFFGISTAPPVSIGTLCHICTHRHIYDFTIISTFIFLSALILWHFNIFHILIFFHSPPTPLYDIHFHIIYVNFVFFHIHIGIFLPMFF